MKLRLIALGLIVPASLHAQDSSTETGWVKAIHIGPQSYTDSPLRPAPTHLVIVSGPVIESEMVGRKVADAPVQLHSSFTLSGKVSVAGGGTDIEFPRLGIRLTPEDGNSPDVTADVTKDASFNLTELRPTTYQLRLTGLPDGWYLRSAVFGENNVLSEGLKLSEGDEKHRLEIGISAGASKVRGIVTDQEFQDPVANAVVKLFPDPPNPHRADLSRTAPTDKDGSFVIENVVPGTYRALAVMGQGGGDTIDDSLIAAAAGVRVVLAEKQSKHLELELFAAHR